jgi:bacterioferritin-associated ferredoxin
MSDDKQFPDEEVMCLCSGTTCGQIRVMFLQGLDTEAISRKTGALTGCGGCEWDLDAFLKQLAAEAEATKLPSP